MPSNPLQETIQLFSKLPGIGQRSARRIVLHLLRNRANLMLPMADALNNAADSVVKCKTCGNMDVTNPCGICCDHSRERGVICVVEDLADLWAIERTRHFKGLYHVLGGTLSAIDGRGPDALNVSGLAGRVTDGGVQEVILATNATVEGQTTAHYITEILKDYGVKITRLSVGIPVGGELEYLDDGTLATALKARYDF